MCILNILSSLKKRGEKKGQIVYSWGGFISRMFRLVCQAKSVLVIIIIIIFMRWFLSFCIIVIIILGKFHVYLYIGLE